MKSAKREAKEGIEQPKQQIIRTLAEKENYKYLEILESDILKQAEMKKRKPPTPRKLLEPSFVAEIFSKKWIPGLYSL